MAKGSARDPNIARAFLFVARAAFCNGLAAATILDITIVLSESRLRRFSNEK